MGTLQEAMAKLLRKPKPPAEEKDEKPPAEKIAEKLPAVVMPLEAVKKKRERLKQLDEETKE
jgi:hypothetical protein